jgi:hypothetical protein
MKNKLSYQTEVKVYLDGKQVGVIKEISDIGYKYFPKGYIEGGELYSTLEACKKSLE